tara:strand:- start:3947 stop:4228 length:282 start_codon:yes stop_codon:yes gene_type:complete
VKLSGGVLDGPEKTVQLDLQKGVSETPVIWLKKYHRHELQRELTLLWTFAGFLLTLMGTVFIVVKGLPARISAKMNGSALGKWSPGNTRVQSL